MKRHCVFLLFFLGVALSLQSKPKRDTLYSESRDRIILDYDVSFRNNQYVLRFTDVRKILGNKFKEKFKPSRVKVMFFDREGNYDDIRFAGKSTEAFSIPSSVSYNCSADGFFFIDDDDYPELTFRATTAFKLSVPVYLAYYEKKMHYNIFASCGSLEVEFPSKRNTGSHLENQASPAVTIISQEEEGEANIDIRVVEMTIRNVNELLAEQDELPFTDDLRDAVSRLRALRENPSVMCDKRVAKRIDEVLDNCREKEKELKTKSRAAAEAEKRTAEQKEELARQEALAREDSIQAANQLRAEEQKKQNIWLIIGGIILAILTFVGNQLFQHFRNLKNQKSMLDMQQSVVKRAEDEARRRARNAAHSQVNRVKTEARKKTQDFVNGTMGKTGKDKKKGNKDYSI